MDITKQLELFEQLTYDERKEKVLEMLKQLQWTHETFAMFYTTVRSMHNISETALIYLYQAILEIVEEIDAERKDEAQEKIKRMAEVLMVMKKQEEMEMEHEGNSDDIGENL